MSKKREQMIQKARKKLQESEPVDETNDIQKEEKTPSFMAAYFLMFAGTLFVVYSWGQPFFLIGLLFGLPLIFIGMKRSFKATSARTAKRSL